MYILQQTYYTYIISIQETSTVRDNKIKQVKK